MALYPRTGNTSEIRPSSSLDESPLFPSKKLMTLKINISFFATNKALYHVDVNTKAGGCVYCGVYSLAPPQMGCRGRTLEAWYFGFPQQQQWTQDSMIIKRNVAERRDRRQGAGRRQRVGLVHSEGRV